MFVVINLKDKKNDKRADGIIYNTQRLKGYHSKWLAPFRNKTKLRRRELKKKQKTTQQELTHFEGRGINYLQNN
jgi:hypothetical protein